MSSAGQPQLMTEIFHKSPTEKLQRCNHFVRKDLKFLLQFPSYLCHGRPGGDRGKSIDQGGRDHTLAPLPTVATDAFGRGRLSSSMSHGRRRPYPGDELIAG